MTTPIADHHRPPWELAVGQTLTELLNVTAHTTDGGCRWRRGHCALSDSDRLDAAAWLVAEEIMRLRCGRAERIFLAWRRAATGTRPADEDDPSLAAAFIESTFGLPPDGASEDHAEGYVAEIAWRMLTHEEQGDERSIAHLAVPDPDVTAPGGDGFVIYRGRARAELAFRLWEIKKRDGDGSVSATIRAAYKQLNANAERYLAKITGQTEAPDLDPDVLDLLAELVPAWKRSDDRAGAGVAVAANAQGLPVRAFTTMHEHFPAFTAGRIEGCLLGLGSLRDFALHVRKLLWTGLSAASN